MIGGSAGGLEPLKNLLAELPAGLPAAILVVIHTAADSAGVLPCILSRSSRLPAVFPEHNARLKAGMIYVAPPDHHLLVADSRAMIVRGPRDNGFRPAIDPLFRSAADAHGPKVIGVILSGALADGSFGLRAIKEAGGIAIVQHPDEALVNSMPLRAIQEVEADYILPVAEISKLLVQLVQDSHDRSHDGGNGSFPSIKTAPAMPKRSKPSQSGPAGASQPLAADELRGSPSTFTCPECGGSLWELQEGKSFRFRCHTGHGFTPEALLKGQGEELEHALWSAVRVLKERAGIHDQIAERMRGNRLADLAQQYQKRADDERKKSRLIEEVLAQSGDAMSGVELSMAPPGSVAAK